MKFLSTNNSSHVVDFKQAVIAGLAPDKGLYLPRQITPLSQQFWHTASSLSLQEISLAVAKQILTDSLPPAILETIVSEAINFDAPIKPLTDNISVLELFHGPTLAFKDFGARFMARVMSHFMKDEDQALHVLVATSGDTGGAVANGFYKTPGVKVTLLYPAGKVSHLQELQLTTLGENISALEVDGTFDDCQALVKEAFLDQDLRSQMLLSSANSINISRLIPQSFYYAYLAAQVASENLIVSVPSGNFGNLTAGIIAQRLGAPISKFIAATNINDIVPAYLHSGEFTPRTSVQTLSNAMDVGNPSNFARLLYLHDHSLTRMRDTIVGFHVTDVRTKEVLTDTYKASNYILDPHGAVGLDAIYQYQEAKGKSGDFVFLETAHPAKFIDIVEEALSSKIQVPARLAELEGNRKLSKPISTSYPEFRELLIYRR